MKDSWEIVPIPANKSSVFDVLVDLGVVVNLGPTAQTRMVSLTDYRLVDVLTVSVDSLPDGALPFELPSDESSTVLTHPLGLSIVVPRSRRGGGSHPPSLSPIRH